jgi:phosphohistidine swiveling domain-containing protein
MLVTASEATAEHGGKALGLKRLEALGLSVPNARLLDKHAVDAVVSWDEDATNELREWLASSERRVAVRSSALAEDGDERSFAGVFATSLNVEPKLAEVVKAVSEVAAGGQLARAHAYKMTESGSIPVIVQEMVEQPFASGVAFSQAVGIDGSNSAYVEWVHGLGDALVSGRLDPATLSAVWADDSRAHIDRSSFVARGMLLGEKLAHDLLEMIEVVKRENKSERGWDVEWTIDSNGKLWALQLRPITAPVVVASPFRPLDALSASTGVAEGTSKFVDDDNFEELIEGEVLVAEVTEAQYLPAMLRASAIVTEQGGLLSHAAIIAREYSKPCLVGAKGAMSKLKDRQLTRVDGSRGLVEQQDISLGTSETAEIDMGELFLYDRGLLATVEGKDVYIEPTLAGHVAFVDEASGGELSSVEAALRRRFCSPVKISVDQKSIWHEEWIRYSKLSSVLFIKSLFDQALSQWNDTKLHAAIGTLKDTVKNFEKTHENEIQELFWAEVGAAMHTVATVVVEGEAVWRLYRDTYRWRDASNVPFRDLISNTGGCQLALPGAKNIDSCLKLLAQLRNESYEFFVAENAFETEYFGRRSDLVDLVCKLWGLPFEDEGSALSDIYLSPEFDALDRSLSQKIYERHFVSH